MVTPTQHYLPPAPIGSPDGSVAWVEWYRKLREVAESGQASYDQLTNVTDPALQGKLNKNAADVLGGTITFSSLGAFKVGNVTWNGTTVTGTGVMFTENGIVGANSGVAKFVLKGDGSATFGGALSAATGTFSGSLSAATGTFSGTVQAGSFVTAASGQRISINEGNNNKILYYNSSGQLIMEVGGTTGCGYFPNGSVTNGPAVYGVSSGGISAVYGYSPGNASGIEGVSTTGYGLQGFSTNNYSLYCSGGLGAYISGNMTVTGTLNATVSNATNASVATVARAVTSLTGNAIMTASTGYSAQMQTDGNFVVYGVSTWASGTNLSDVRKKENIQPTAKSGLDVVNQLSVKDFSWKRDGLTAPNITGFIAQEVAQVIPNAVSTVDAESNNDYKDLHFLHKDEIVPYLVKAIQELHQEVLVLKGKVESYGTIK